MRTTPMAVWRPMEQSREHLRPIDPAPHTTSCTLGGQRPHGPPLAGQPLVARRWPGRLDEPHRRERCQGHRRGGHLRGGHRGCERQKTFPIAVNTRLTAVSLHQFATLVVRGSGADFPGLSGLKSLLEQRHSVLDCSGRSSMYHLPPGSLDPAGARTKRIFGDGRRRLRQGAPTSAEERSLKGSHGAACRDHKRPGIGKFAPGCTFPAATWLQFAPGHNRREATCVNRGGGCLHRGRLLCDLQTASLELHRKGGHWCVADACVAAA